jgi:membrane-associated phospholipid phosphatase
VYRKIALALTVVFQPLIVPSLVVALLFYAIPESTSVPIGNRWSIWLLVMETTLLIPMLSVIGMRMTSFLPSLQMVTKEERVWPFSVTALFYLMTWCFFYFKLNIDPLLVFSLGVITLCVVLLTLITYFWKISAHLTGLSGLLAIIAVLAHKFPSTSLLYPLMGAVLLCGLVGSARLLLDAHKPTEILGGFILGFSVCFFAFYWYQF